MNVSRGIDPGSAVCPWHGFVKPNDLLVSSRLGRMKQVSLNGLLVPRICRFLVFAPGVQLTLNSLLDGKEHSQKKKGLFLNDR
jgi:hypothetical protein